MLLLNLSLDLNPLLDDCNCACTLCAWAGNMQETCDEVFQSGTLLLDPAQEKVIRQHRRHRDGNAYGCRNQRIADRTGHHIKTGRTAGGNLMHRMHDAQHRAKQSDKRRGAADTG